MKMMMVMMVMVMDTSLLRHPPRGVLSSFWFTEEKCCEERRGVMVIERFKG